MIARFCLKEDFILRLCFLHVYLVKIYVLGGLFALKVIRCTVNGLVFYRSLTVIMIVVVMRLFSPELSATSQTTHICKGLVERIYICSRLQHIAEHVYYRFSL